MKQRRSIDMLSALHNTHRAMNLVRNKLMSGVDANMPAARSMARKRLANVTFDSLISRTIGGIDDHTMHRPNIDGSVAAGLDTAVGVISVYPPSSARGPECVACKFENRITEKKP